MYSGDEEDNDDDALVRSSAAKNSEIKIRYKYQPSEEIRRRQFCTMAQMEGYDDPVAFGVHVADMTAQDRTKMLERLYRTRRRELVEEFAQR
jgi:hypothetical protein